MMGPDIHGLSWGEAIVQREEDMEGASPQWYAARFRYYLAKAEVLLAHGSLRGAAVAVAIAEAFGGAVAD